MRTVVLLLACAALLPASQIVSLSSGNLSAQAEFTFYDGGFTLTLTNTTPTTDASDLLTDFIFTLSATGSATYGGVTGQLVDVSDTGAVSNNNTATPGWGFGIYSGGVYNGEYLLCTVCGAGVTAPNQPSQGILGPGTGSGSTPYSTANGSIRANQPHNPFFLNSATFSFTGSSITTDTLARSVNFSYSTTFGPEYPGTDGGGGGGGGGQVPEPMTLMLTGSALLGLGFFTKHRRAK